MKEVIDYSKYFNPFTFKNHCYINNKKVDCKKYDKKMNKIQKEIEKEKEREKEREKDYNINYIYTPFGTVIDKTLKPQCYKNGKK